MAHHDAPRPTAGLRSVHRKIKLRKQSRPQARAIVTGEEQQQPSVLQAFGSAAENAYAAVAGSVLSILHTVEDIRAEASHNRKQPR